MGTGLRAGGPLCAHPKVKAISFTGSTRVGGEIALGAARTFKKVSLEMGGKNATVVCADADLPSAVSEAVRAAFSNQGQICLCGSRVLVEKSIAVEFKARFVAQVRALRVGDPRERGTDQGALTSKAHFEKVLGCLETARAEGGRVLCGGERVQVPGRCEKGYFISPTVLEGLGPHARTNQEEIFGPVVTLQEFEGDAQALALANATRYGLAASVFTKELSRAHRLAAGLRAGLVWINCWMVRDLRTPFGGVGDSGVGREGGQEAMRFFTEPKNVTVKL
jgi:aminomuconate-semialdehyde/2-hydroxymuconate-6-semialdehyde dehydrogenase